MLSYIYGGQPSEENVSFFRHETCYIIWEIAGIEEWYYEHSPAGIIVLLLRLLHFQQGVNILVNIWDRDNTSVTDDMVDEFTYDFTDLPGSGARTIDIESVRDPPKSW